MEEGHVSVRRFIDQMDRCFDRNDMKAARECLQSWESEARRLGDDRGLLAVLNEAVGFYRRTQKRGKALAAMEECLQLVDRLSLEGQAAGATVLTNAATTLAFFGEPEKALELYDRAAACFEAAGGTDTYEYAALLNNRAGTLYGLKRYDAAEAAWRGAVEILKAEGRHDGEIAISLVMLAHLTFDRDDTAYAQVEALLDQAWEYINAPNQPRDGNYAYVLRKCAPSFDYFRRPEAAQALREVAKEIYEGS